MDRKKEIKATRSSKIHQSIFGAIFFTIEFILENQLR